MKKLGVLLIVLILLGIFSFVLIKAQEPNVTDLESDANKIQGALNQVPLTPEGEINQTAFQGYKSKAEERIQKINDWLDINAPWLIWIFGMVPEISWLFAMNLYIWLFFFVLFVMNALVIRIPIELVMAFGKGSADKEVTVSRIIGSGIFVFLIWKKILFNISLFFYNFWVFVFEWVLPVAFWVAVIVIILIIVALILLIIYAPELLVKLGEIYEKWKEERAKKKAKEDAEKLHEDMKVADKFTEGLTGGEGI